jgi:GT2 family glycosyltransferase
MDPLRIPPCQAPEISVVLVTYNAWEWTERALRALVDTTEVPYELVVVDNASTDSTRERLAGLEHARVSLQESNRGYGVAANLGVIMARAPRVLLLNSDCMPRPGWLPPLLEVLDGEDDVAATGARLDNVDGTLQEAGSIVWGDGASDNYGDGDDPRRPEYRFRRDVDYLSAACLLVRRSAFCDAGGFDPLYHPAYYEDTDLAMRWRSRGLRVVYQPRSTAVHKRWASSGDRGGMVGQLLRNRPVFVERWRELLGDRPPRPDPEDAPSLLALRDVECPERVLVAVGRLDSPAGALAERLVRACAARAPRWRVTLLCWDENAETPVAEALRAAGAEVVGGRGEPGDWLEFRRRHHSVVVAEPSLPTRAAVMLRDTQPHAVRVALVAAETARAPSPWLDGARLAVCDGTDVQASLQRTHPGLPAVVVSGAEPTAGIASVAHRLGLRLD